MAITAEAIREADAEFKELDARKAAAVDRRREVFLAALREGWTQEQIASLVGVTRARISQIVGRYREV